MNIYSAYLHGRIKHDFYITLQDGYGKPGKVSKLNKVLYSSAGAACIWREDLKEKLKALGFTPLMSDTGIFLHKSTEGIIVSPHMWTMVWEYA